MNEIRHLTITIELDLWQPFHREFNKELDELLCKLRSKHLLNHTGNVKTTLRYSDQA